MTSSQQRADILQDRFGLKAASYLSSGASDISYDISERLRASRVQAVGKRKVELAASARGAVATGGAAALHWGGFSGFGWWSRVASVVPLIALVVGLLTINSVQNDNRAQEVADVDAALLTDDLPPAAFADAGFLQFLKSTR
jgi:Protein of unknown function (DUF3619)